jgi:uncharacterized cofD-like protein
MRSTQLLAELLISGVIFLVSICFYCDATVTQKLFGLCIYPPLDLLVIFLCLAYVIGHFANVVSEKLFEPLQEYFDRIWYKEYGNADEYKEASKILDKMRYDLYTSTHLQVIERLNYHRTFLRLSRSIGLLAAISLLLALIPFSGAYGLKNIIGIIISPVILMLSIWSFKRRRGWFNKSTYLSWKAANKKTVIPALAATTGKQPKIVAFTGGTAFRRINMTLLEKTKNISRIVPVFDSGGSSRILREHFDMLPIGDIRNALITMAPRSGSNRKIARLFNWRLPEDENATMEFDQIIEGTHTLIRDIDFDLKKVIIGYLKRFKDGPNRIKNSNSVPLDLRKGSVGNFILVGAYLSHKNDISSAIYIFRQLCGIEGNVFPVSLEGDIHLGAELIDGNSIKENIFGQDEITTLDRTKYSNQIINEIFFTKENKKNPVRPFPPLPIDSNPSIFAEIEKADTIIIGPGSFFTSIAPHFMVNGIAEAIGKRQNVPKIFIANLTECVESYGQDIEQLLDKLFAIMKSYDKTNEKNSDEINRYITHIIVPKSVPSDYIYDKKETHKRKYLKTGNIGKFQNKYGIKIVEADIEDPWNRGEHDPEVVGEMILNV